MKYKAIGWIRDRKGIVIRYNIKDVCNCITPFGMGGADLRMLTREWRTQRRMCS